MVLIRTIALFSPSIIESRMIGAEWVKKGGWAHFPGIIRPKDSY